MKICVAQTKPITGDIQSNIARHETLIGLAIGTDLIIFPELSVTGYEPTLAKGLATNPDDNRFTMFQNLSDVNQIAIGVGVPTKHEQGTCISLILFQPQLERQTYSKKYLHVDEEPFFVPGPNLPRLTINQHKIALAVCYEISVSKHEEITFENNPDIYIASVAKFVNGIDTALERLSTIARKHAVPVLMSNCIGQCDGAVCAGKTSAWNNSGKLVGQLDGSREGILIFDTESQTTTEVII